VKTVPGGLSGERPKEKQSREEEAEGSQTEPRGLFVSIGLMTLHS